MTQLQVQALEAFYGGSQVLWGVDFSLAAGEMLAVLGRNGAGRSTLAKALMGQVDCKGRVHWNGKQLLGRKTYEIANCGLGYVPESRDVFPLLTVHQNLLLGQKSSAVEPPAWSFEALYRLFPQLLARQHTAAGVLSGGEQQMLSLCRALMGNPQLLIVDEPTEGLAPQLVAQVADCLRTLRARGVAILLIEQKRAMALELSDRCLVLGHGRVVFDGTPRALQADGALCREWLEV